VALARPATARTAPAGDDSNQANTNSQRQP
jgi:hypothetical protein